MEEDMHYFLMEKEKQRELVLKRIQEDDQRFHLRKIEEKVAKEQVSQIKEIIYFRKREIVEEIKAIRLNSKVKNGVNVSGSGLSVLDTQSTTSKQSAFLNKSLSVNKDRKNLVSYESQPLLKNSK